MAWRGLWVMRWMEHLQVDPDHHPVEFICFDEDSDAFVDNALALNGTPCDVSLAVNTLARDVDKGVVFSRAALRDGLRIVVPVRSVAGWLLAAGSSICTLPPSPRACRLAEAVPDAQHLGLDQGLQPRTLGHDNSNSAGRGTAALGHRYNSLHR